ncbi:hypothetical protein VIBNISFn27_200012 [Vibrio nigripulchritudo SFn27]|uniref:Uncharacterized protein n=1 Tax=Vibrio nigripulchritudo TaxID=28173 RepID=U4KI10_9VIBR|nr:hypothetical protein [Vibrio nigripulchritudo]CCN80997.1 hypothetical protein VIBNIBLFn1_140013 [Vibrio nigripulchritudo BLFn1]CCN87928.1 hypothetical protein VIBNISFn27_200012 [Vibrio nigripulchritudo SFn27]CCN96282.1 hypothetical protein VIBNIENn2_730033 [Vibrio nigripulchritudo ENn2]CCO42147.1 hypothetical protein VIBNISFn135_760011 [Vibrio nigripulchritudo SFn135]CCO55289.1 hypothetical protein VIBNIWn13_800012 [Vibrio nigripulchritudo Wn13]
MKNWTITLLLSIFASTSFAGVDIASTVERLRVNGDGKLWIKMTDPGFDKYCKTGWYGFNMYIPESDKSYPFYYAMLTTALSNGHSIYIANISKFNGSDYCDLTQTGYGIVLRR